MKQLNQFKGTIRFSSKSYFIFGIYLIIAIIMGVICFFPLLSELSFRNAYFLSAQARLQNYRYINRFQFAFEEYEKAIRYFPLESHYASEYIKTLDTYISKLKTKDEKIYYLNKAISLMKYIQTIDSINPWYHARISALYAQLTVHSNDHLPAQKSTFHARQALLSDYENPIFLLNYANILHQNKRFSEAFYYYKKVIDIDDRIAEAHFNLASILTKLNQFPAALNSYLTAKSLNKTFKYIDAVILQTYIFIKEYEKAEQYINLYELFYSKEDKTLDIISFFYLTQKKFLLSLSYLDMYLDLPQFKTKSPSNIIFERYIICLKNLNKTTEIKTFISSQLTRYPNNAYLQSL